VSNLTKVYVDWPVQLIDFWILIFQQDISCVELLAVATIAITVGIPLLLCCMGQSVMLDPHGLCKTGAHRCAQYDVCRIGAAISNFRLNLLLRVVLFSSLSCPVCTLPRNSDYLRGTVLLLQVPRGNGTPPLVQNEWLPPAFG